MKHHKNNNQSFDQNSRREQRATHDEFEYMSFVMQKQARAEKRRRKLDRRERDY